MHSFIHSFIGSSQERISHVIVATFEYHSFIHSFCHLCNQNQTTTSTTTFTTSTFIPYHFIPYHINSIVIIIISSSSSGRSSINMSYRHSNHIMIHQHSFIHSLRTRYHYQKSFFIDIFIDSFIHGHASHLHQQVSPVFYFTSCFSSFCFVSILHSIHPMFLLPAPFQSLSLSSPSSTTCHVHFLYRCI